MKIIFKLIFFICLFSGIFGFSQKKKAIAAPPQIAVPREINEDTEIHGKNPVKTPLKTARDSIQSEVYNVITGIYYWNEVLEDKTDDKIFVLQDKVKTSKGLRKALYAYYLANTYQSYLSEFSNRIKIVDPTPLVTLPEDYRQWAISDFQEQTEKNYQIALSFSEELKSEKTALWNILVENTEFSKFKPTLFDLVATSYMQFLNSGKISKVSDEKISKIKQDLYDFHKNDTDKTAFLYLQSTSLTGSPEEQSKALENLANAHLSEPFAAYLFYNAATLNHDWHDPARNIRAHNLCTKAVTAVLPTSDWQNHCKKLINGLEEKNVEIKLPFNNTPGEYIPVLVSHKNASDFKISILKRSKNFTGNLDEDKDFSTTYQLMTNRNHNITEKNLRSENIQLKKFTDYTEHKTFVAIPPLEKGVYEVTTTVNNKDVNETIAVDDLFYLKREEDNTHVSFQVLNSVTGKALNNRQFEMYQSINIFDRKNSSGRKNKLVKTGTGNTDENGLFSLPKSSDRDYSNTIVYFPQSRESIILTDDYDDIRKEADVQKNEQKIFRKFLIYTDRAIYRPGQKVFYKGILMQEFFEQTKVFEKQKVNIEFYNEEKGEVIAKTEAVTNEFGSVSGEFILPTGKPGGYTIIMTLPNPDPTAHDKLLAKDAYGIIAEEYKRPRFEVQPNQIKETYRFGDEISVSGNTVAFSGAKISSAKVRYEVQRNRVYVWRNYDDSFNYIPEYDNSFVAHGETITDSDGNFKISFKADPNAKNLSKNRSYQYTVSLNVTDTNGETQSASQVVYVGDLPAKIDLIMPQTAKQSDLKTVDVSVKNLNNQNVAATGKLTVTRLLTAEKIVLPKYIAGLFRNREPDFFRNAYQLYDKTLFDAYFPNLNYEFPSDKLSKGEIVFTKEFNTDNTSKIVLNTLFKPGNYIFEAESIFKNDTIRNYKIVEVLDDTTLENGSPVFFKSFENTALKVGEKGKLGFQTSFPEGYLNYRFLRSGKAGELQQLAFRNGFAEISFTPTLQDLKDGLYIEYDFIHSNDFAKEERPIRVEESVNRNLEIITEVFRDKITPGAKEKWHLKIKAKDNAKINAEVLAAMYDASLDQFAKNSFTFYPDQPDPRFWLYDYQRDGNYYTRPMDFLRRLELFEETNTNFGLPKYVFNDRTRFPTPQLPDFVEKNIELWRRQRETAAYAENRSASEVVITRFSSAKPTKSPIFVIDGKISDKNLPENEIADTQFLESSAAIALYGEAASGGAFVITSKKARQEELLTKITARKNLDETAFFFPTLTSDANGETTVEFTSPEALKRWKLLVFAHTKDLKTGSAEFITKTQKEIMVTPNPPRFLRQGDQITFAAKIDNLSDDRLKGDATLYLFDPATKKPLDSAFINKNYLTKFEVESKSSKNVEWTIKVPNNITEVGYKILAGTKTFSDGEENTIPILSNRLMLTDTQSVFVKEGQTKTYEIPEILNPTSNSASNFKLSVDLTANPVWFAVMSLPYLREYPYECSEQLFSRLYGNILSTYIMNSSPKIKKVFDEWNAKESLSNPLEQNEELKSILLEETPWIKELKTEDDKMRELAVLFNINKMTRDLKKAQRDLVDRQNPDGSFSWFPGGGKDKTISAHILAGFGKLKLLLKDKTDDYFTNEIEKVIKNSIKNIDEEYYDRLIEERKQTDIIDNNDYADYFYTRSFWLKDKNIPDELYKVLNPLSKQYDRDFDNYSLFQQAKIATMLYRFGYKEIAKKMISNIKNRAVTTEESGMYWTENIDGWYWHQSKVATQAILIGAFAEITPADVKSVEEMKVWLIKNKQIDSWDNTRSTTEAVFALMNYGKSWLDAEKGITMKLGAETIYPNTKETSENGYFKTSYKWKEITPDKGRLEITKTSPGVAWGGIYRQYFENFESVKNVHSSDVVLDKKLYLTTYSSGTPKLQEISGTFPVKVGDIVTVRILVKTNKAMQYIHLQDMRAAGMEPVDTMSGYHHQNGGGYYQNTRDTATNFFFDALLAGTYVFEYQLKANNAGNFTAGIATFQNMYAPAMSAHTEGSKVAVER